MEFREGQDSKKLGTVGKGEVLELGHGTCCQHDIIPLKLQGRGRSCLESKPSANSAVNIIVSERQHRRDTREASMLHDR